MGIETLIKRLNQYSQFLIAYKLGADFADTCMDAAAVLSTIQTENEKLRDELEQVKAGRDAAIEYLREIEWCAGCKHFGGLDGCKKWAMGQCTEKHDFYEFVGPHKED